MQILFYLHATIAVIAMACAMLLNNTVHALLSAVFSILCIAISMYILSAPVAGLLLAIVYAGAIMVLFVFAIMLLQTPEMTKQKFQFSLSRSLLSSFVSVLFFVEVCFVIRFSTFSENADIPPSLNETAKAMFLTYGLSVEVVSFVLLAGLAAAIFVGRNFVSSKKEARHDTH